MKRLTIGAIIIAPILVLGFWAYQHEVKSSAPDVPSEEAEIASSASTPSQLEQAPVTPVEQSAEEQVLLNLEKEAQRIGQVSDEPDEEELRLNEQALQLKPPELKKYLARAQDKTVNGDERFLAVDLIARNGSDAAIALLKDFVLSPEQVSFSSDPSSNMDKETEMMLRARALDGIAQRKSPQAIKAIHDVIQRTDNSVLSDRAHRHRAHLEEGAPSVQEQEERALRELLEQP